MGTFEKLGILVIVVIIVMILAVAIYQWGGAPGDPAAGALEGGFAELSIHNLPAHDRPAPEGDAKAPADKAMWPGGIPRKYTIQSGDKLWVVVVNRWKLRHTFIAAISAANPQVELERLQPFDVLTIPDPRPFVRRAGDAQPKKPAAGRRYEIQGGDTLENIARHHLGRKSRWREIAELNGNLDPKRLRAGQVIMIPAK